jgi:hypothetical protein
MRPGASEESEGIDHGAVLVVRLWTDGGFPEGLRARITSTLDIAAPGEDVTVTADVETILATVREWLTAFLAG